jgi:hypothetical protein
MLEVIDVCRCQAPPFGGILMSVGVKSPPGGADFMSAGVKSPLGVGVSMCGLLRMWNTQGSHLYGWGCAFWFWGGEVRGWALATWRQAGACPTEGAAGGACVTGDFCAGLNCILGQISSYCRVPTVCSQKTFQVS